MGDNRVVDNKHQQITRKRKLDEALNPVVINGSSVFTFGGNGNNIITMNGNNITVNGRNNVISLNGKYVFTNNGNAIVNVQNNVTSFNSRYIFANNGNIIVNGRSVVLNGVSVAQDSIAVAQKARAVAQNARAVAQNARAVAQNGRAVAQNSIAVAQNARAVAQNARAVTQNGRAVTQNGSGGVCASYTSNVNGKINVCKHTSGKSYPVAGITDACTPTPQKRAKNGTDSTPVVVASNDGKEHPAILDGEECTICYELFTRIADVAFLPCAHYFHKKCVDNWLEYDNTCPVCRVNAVTGASE